MHKEKFGFQNIIAKSILISLPISSLLSSCDTNSEKPTPATLQPIRESDVTENILRQRAKELNKGVVFVHVQEYDVNLDIKVKLDKTGEDQPPSDENVLDLVATKDVNGKLIPLIGAFLIEDCDSNYRLSVSNDRGSTFNDIQVRDESGETGNVLRLDEDCTQEVTLSFIK